MAIPVGSTISTTNPYEAITPYEEALNPLYGKTIERIDEIEKKFTILDLTDKRDWANKIMDQNPAFSNATKGEALEKTIAYAKEAFESLNRNLDQTFVLHVLTAMKQDIVKLFWGWEDRGIDFSEECKEAQDIIQEAERDIPEIIDKMKLEVYGSSRRKRMQILRSNMNKEMAVYQMKELINQAVDNVKSENQQIVRQTAEEILNELKEQIAYGKQMPLLTPLRQVEYVLFFRDEGLTPLVKKYGTVVNPTTLKSTNIEEP